MSQYVGTFAGIRMHTTRYLPPRREVGHKDWRERLTRNLARPSWGTWEPLTHRIGGDCYLINGEYFLTPEAHKMLVARMVADIDNAVWNAFVPASPRSAL